MREVSIVVGESSNHPGNILPGVPQCSNNHIPVMLWDE